MPSTLDLLYQTKLFHKQKHKNDIFSIAILNNTEWTVTTTFGFLKLIVFHSSLQATRSEFQGTLLKVCAHNTTQHMWSYSQA